MGRLDIQNKRVLVVGLGASGAAVARFLHARGALVTVTDRAKTPDAADQVPALAALGVRMVLGEHPPEIFTEAQLIVLSPGVPETLAPIRAAAAAGVPVTGELALAARFIDRPLVAVTGTNGKTTTTRMLTHLLCHAGIRAVACGNIGPPLIGFADPSVQADVLVVEVSSFQLDTAERFVPAVSVLLNITPDHLDRYGDMAAYARSKGRIFRDQAAGHTVVLNGADPLVRELGAAAAARKWFFHAASGQPGAVLVENRMELRLPGLVNLDLDFSGLKLPGAHNRENAAAAVLAAIAAGAAPGALQAGLDTFAGLPHRIAFAGRVDGVDFFNDSKATNIDAVAKALASFDRPVVLIMGGRNKGYRFHALAGAMAARVKHLLVMGEAADAIVADTDGVAPVQRAGSMAEAVAVAHRLAVPGDVVLLSPGCASFDMFNNYKHRGDAFCSEVAALTSAS